MIKEINELSKHFGLASRSLEVTGPKETNPTKQIYSDQF
jgi:hypothetical protein